MVNIMNEDYLFRTILIFGFAVLIPFMFYYRIRSQASGEKLDRRQEGLGLLIGIRLFGLITAVSLISFLINPENMNWSAITLPLWLRWLGVILGALAGSLILYTFHNLGTNLTDTVVTRKNHTFITSGPYRWVRHPFYVAMALAVLANSLAAANWFMLATGATVIILLALRTDIEEVKLIERFGDDYRQYMNRVNRFIPKFN